MDDPVEVELKLEYDPADRDRLLASACPAEVEARRACMIATYFDTPDLELNKAGLALRIRADGDQRTQTLKASGSRSAGLFVRGEWERPVTGDLPLLDEQVGPLQQLIASAALDKIAPIFVTEVERITGVVEAAGAQIEFAIDSGEVHAGSAQTPLAEIEFEIKQGDPRQLFNLARRIAREVPLRLGVQTKSSRGYALIRGKQATAVRAEPIRLDRDHVAAEAFAAIAGSCIRQYRLNETLLLGKGDAETVHQARVALRRLRSAFTLFAPLLKTDGQVDRLTSEIRWLAGELGSVRDIDVLLPKLEGRNRTAVSAVRDGRFAHVRNLLGTDRVRLLPLDLAEWLAVGDWLSDPATRPHREMKAVDFAGQRLDRLRTRIKRHGRRLAHLDDEHRHEVRKDAKKLRYAAEFFVSLYPGRKARRRLDHFLDRLEALQDTLGELNDSAAAALLIDQLHLEIELPTMGRKERARLLDDAEHSLDELVFAKRFWRL